MGFTSLTIDDFAAKLAAGTSTPGGGAAAGLMAKLSACLIQMVANHTAGRSRYAAVEERMQAILKEAAALDRKAGELMDADSAAFGGVSAAFKLPKEDPSRAEAVSEACKVATDVPLDVMRGCAQLAELAAEVYAKGNQTLTGDARSALFAAQAAAECSAGNVRANRSFITDTAWTDRANAEADQLLARIQILRSQVGA